MISTVLDACVLYSAPLRGLLLNLGSAKLIYPYWSEEIQNEWVESLLQNRLDLTREKLEQTCRNMEFHFPNGRVSGYEHRTTTLWLPDPKDQHVLAVAIHVKAKYIVTSDKDGFPITVLQSHGVEAVTPDEFVLRLIKIEPNRVLRAVRNHRMNLTRPPQTVDEYLATLEKQNLHETVTFLREHKDKL
jgi:predicted nucleic acid-binding protein